MATPDQHGDEPLSDVNGQRRYAVVTDRPVEVLNPRRSFLRLNLVWAAALLVVAFAAAYGATAVANRNSEERIAILLAELDRRTAERKANEAATKASSKSAAEVTYRILEQNRRTHCSEMRAVREIDAAAGAGPAALAEIDKLYKVYHCGTAKDPIVPPGWIPPAGWPPLPGAEPLAPPSPSPVPSPATTQ